MIHAAVARTRSHAQLGELLDQENVLPPRRNHARYGAPNNAAANDENVGLVHGDSLSACVDFVEEGLALFEARLCPIVYGVHRVLGILIVVPPKGRGAVLAVFIERVEENVEGG